MRRKIQGLIWLFILFVSSLYAQVGRFPTAPLNPAFVRYIENLKAGQVKLQTTEGKRLGYIPEPVDLSHLKGKSIIPETKFPKLSYPASYDLRTLNRLTPVKNQGTHGTCWAFATYGSLESWLKKDEGTEYDFSENNLVNLHGFDWGFDNGGNYFMSTAYLARWQGPVNEEDDSYPRPGESTGSETVRKHVQEVIYIPRSGSTDNDNIKYAVMNYGAVGTMMCWNDGSYNPTTKAYYYNGSGDPNHAVAIVGWDDNYPASNFNTAPTGNGAFIVRNSWGTGWGDGGYFYVSYYDTVFGSDNFMFNNAEPTWNYSDIYQYDPLGCVDFSNPDVLKAELSANGAPQMIVDAIYSDRVRFANIFTATANQNIVAVGFYMFNTSVNYQLWVRTGVNEGEPESGSVATTQSGTLSVPGYHTIALTSPVSVSEGQRFSVVIRFTSSESPNVAVEGPVGGYSSAATAEVGESFIGFEHTFFLLPSPYWLDTDTDDIEGYYSYENQDVNVCIKAYVEGTPEAPVLVVNPTSLDFGTEETSLTFNVSNGGQDWLNWQVDSITYNQGSGWITDISPTSGTVGEGVDTVTVTVGRTGIPDGVSTAVIHITSNGGNADVNVSIEKPNPILSVSPSSLDFGREETSLSFNINNTGTGRLNWNIGLPIYTSGGSGWIESISPTSGETSSSETDSVNVSVNRSGLPAGVSTAVIPITSDGGNKNVSVSIRVNSPPLKPTNISPSNGATGISLTPLLKTGAFSDPDGDTLSLAKWKIKKGGVVIWQSSNSATSISVPAGVLENSTTYTWQVSYTDNYGAESNWSDETSFTTRASTYTPPVKPVNISPANMATGVSTTPVLKASSFSDPDGDTMADSQWRIRSEAGTYETMSVWENTSAGATTEVLVLPALAENTTYFWQVRYKDSTGSWSSWSDETSFTTKSSGGESSSGGGGGCFIATAAFGTPMAKEVVRLREFRDRYLLTNRPGRAFVRWYYRHSPRLAGYIRQRSWARALVRGVLRPVVWFVSVIMR